MCCYISCTVIFVPVLLLVLLLSYERFQIYIRVCIRVKIRVLLMPYHSSHLDEENMTPSPTSSVCIVHSAPQRIITTLRYDPHSIPPLNSLGVQGGSHPHPPSCWPRVEGGTDDSKKQGSLSLTSI